jgi:hypothetical protein
VKAHFLSPCDYIEMEDRRVYEETAAEVVKHHTDKKEKKILLLYKVIQNEAVAKSYMRKGFLIYGEMRKKFSHI